jgi:hypothetical protein
MSHLLCVQLVVAPHLGGASVRVAEVDRHQHGQSRLPLVDVTRLLLVEVVVLGTIGRHRPHLAAHMLPQVDVVQLMVLLLVMASVSVSLHRPQRKVQAMESTGPVPLGAQVVNRVVCIEYEFLDHDASTRNIVGKDLGCWELALCHLEWQSRTYASM